MNGKDIFMGLKYVGDDLIEKAEYGQFHAAEGRESRLSLRRPFLIAAIIALMVLLMGCAILALNLKDMKIGEWTYTEPRYIDEAGNKIPATEKTMDILSIQGLAGSPEFLAAQEWEAYAWHIPAEEFIDDFDAPAEYDAYLVANQEMQDKIDELCEKYDLKLLGPITGFEDYQQDIFFDALGLSGLTKPDAQVETEPGPGYFYGNGSFKNEFYLTLTGGEAQWPHQLLISYLCKFKGYFDEVTLSVSDIDEVKQWNYSLADGTDVLIMNTGSRAWIFCSREDTFLTAGFDIRYEADDGQVTYMSDRDIELVAEALDFTIEPKQPDMEAVNIKLEASMQKHLEEEAARMETWVNPFIHDYETYSDVIAYMLENSDNPENIYYGLWDLTGDGEAELLIGCADSFGSVKTIVDGEVTTLISNGTDSGYVLCNDRVFLYQNGDHYYYYRVDTVVMDHPDYGIDQLIYDPWDETWSRIRNGVSEALTDEEAVTIIDGYGRIDPIMKPISEYPTDE